MRPSGRVHQFELNARIQTGHDVDVTALELPELTLPELRGGGILLCMGSLFQLVTDVGD